MGFTREVKLELGTFVPKEPHCRLAQLSGILYGAGVFEIGAGGHLGVRISLAFPATARHVLTLLKPLKVEASLHTVTSQPIGLRYEVVLGGTEGEQADLQLFNELGVLSDDFSVQMTVSPVSSRIAAVLWRFYGGFFSAAGLSRRRALPCTSSSPSSGGRSRSKSVACSRASSCL